MSIVEQAARRLEELKRAGVPVPVGALGQGLATEEGSPLAAAASAERADPTPAAAMRKLTAAAANAPTRPAPATQQARVSPQPRKTVELDLVRLERAGYLVPTSARTMQAEEFRHIKRPLLKNARVQQPGSSRLAQIMVTSALPGEGKTFCSINLAMSMAAEIDTAVLLVDADVIHPTVLERLGVPADKGLIDLLSDTTLEFADVVMATNVPKLSILPAGTRTDRATELLASNAMGVLLTKLAEQFPDHVIIFDAPPLLLTNEAKVLASRMGQVVLVVEASATQRDAVARAFEAVEQCPIVMSVLNKAADPQTPVGYGYYYP